MKHEDYIICCICKLEYNYIKEFIDYHLNLGFDKIIIGDNNDLDGETYDELLKNYIVNKQVEIINLRGLTGMQMKFYNNILSDYDFKWCAFIDCDEFLTFADNSNYKNIKDFLKSNNDITNYHIQWKIYGDNDIIDSKDDYSVLNRFTKESTYGNYSQRNNHIKSILSYKEHESSFTENPHTIFKDNAYMPNGEKADKGPFNIDQDFSILYIRHFYTKSLKEWINNKMARQFATKDYWGYFIDLYIQANEWTKEKELYYQKYVENKLIKNNE